MNSVNEGIIRMGISQRKMWELAHLRSPLTGVFLLFMLLLPAAAACSEQSKEKIDRGPRTAEIPSAVSLDASVEGELYSGAITSDIPKGVSEYIQVAKGTVPCTGASGTSCAPREVSTFDLFAVMPAVAASESEERADKVEDVLEKGLWLSESFPALRFISCDSRK